jgi:hypothetical protein
VNIPKYALKREWSAVPLDLQPAEENKSALDNTPPIRYLKEMSTVGQALRENSGNAALRREPDRGE